MELLEFALSGFWKFVGTVIILLIVLHYLVNGLLRLTTRTYRTIMVLSRGWPPKHLDADGDFEDVYED